MSQANALLVLILCVFVTVSESTAFLFTVIV